MTPHTLNGYTVLIPDIPDDAEDIELHERPKSHITYKVGMGTDDFDILRETLPSGDWTLYRLSEVPEDLAMEMVEWYEDTCDSSDDPMYNVATRFKIFTDYLEGDDLDTAHASFVSWVRAQGIAENDPWILINKND